MHKNYRRPVVTEPFTSNDKVTFFSYPKRLCRRTQRQIGKRLIKQERFDLLAATYASCEIRWAWYTWF